jgi:hypothetical protein
LETVVCLDWVPVLQQKLERIVFSARECLIDPGLTAEVSLSGKCPKKKSVSALAPRMFPDPVLIVLIETIRRGMLFGK